MRHGNLKVKETIWINTKPEQMSMGMVKAFDEITKETKFYIGTGVGSPRDNQNYNSNKICEDMDIKLIIDWGSKVNPQMIIDFFTVKEKNAKPKTNN